MVARLVILIVAVALSASCSSTQPTEPTTPPPVDYHCTSGDHTALSKTDGTPIEALRTCALTCDSEDVDCLSLCVADALGISAPCGGCFAEFERCAADGCDVACAEQDGDGLESSSCQLCMTSTSCFEEFTACVDEPIELPALNCSPAEQEVVNTVRMTGEALDEFLVTLDICGSSCTSDDACFTECISSETQATISSTCSGCLFEGLACARDSCEACTDAEGALTLTEACVGCLAINRCGRRIRACVTGTAHLSVHEHQLTEGTVSRALPSQTVTIHLEHPSHDEHEHDTGESGQDHIPYVFPIGRHHRFCATDRHDEAHRFVLHHDLTQLAVATWGAVPPCRDNVCTDACHDVFLPAGYYTLTVSHEGHGVEGHDDAHGNDTFFMQLEGDDASGISGFIPSTWFNMVYVGAPALGTTSLHAKEGVAMITTITGSAGVTYHNVILNGSTLVGDWSNVTFDASSPYTLQVGDVTKCTSQCHPLSCPVDTAACTGKGSGPGGGCHNCPKSGGTHWVWEFPKNSAGAPGGNMGSCKWDTDPNPSGAHGAPDVQNCCTAGSSTTPSNCRANAAACNTCLASHKKDIRRCSLTGVDFSHISSLKNTSFTGCDLSSGTFVTSFSQTAPTEISKPLKTSFKGLTLDRVKFESCVMHRVDFEGVKFKQTQFINSDLLGATGSPTHDDEATKDTVFSGSILNLRLVPRQTTKLCSNGSPCGAGDTCSPGTCTGGGACDAQGQCAIGTCTDGAPCTAQGACALGKCLVGEGECTLDADGNGSSCPIQNIPQPYACTGFMGPCAGHQGTCVGFGGTCQPQTIINSKSYSKLHPRMNLQGATVHVDASLQGRSADGTAEAPFSFPLSFTLDVSGVKFRPPKELSDSPQGNALTNDTGMCLDGKTACTEDTACPGDSPKCVKACIFDNTFWTGSQAAFTNGAQPNQCPDGTGCPASGSCANGASCTGNKALNVDPMKDGFSSLGSTDTDWSNCSFKSAVLSTTSWNYAFLRRSNWTYATASGASFQHANFKQSIMNFSSFATSDFTSATFTGGSPNVALSGVDLRGTTLTNANFTDATMIRANLGSGSKTTTATGAKFVGANLSEAIFRDVLLSDVTFKAATLTSANFIGATLTNAQFTNSGEKSTELTKAQFCGAELGTVSFAGADLTNAIIPSANASCDADNPCPNTHACTQLLQPNGTESGECVLSLTASHGDTFECHLARSLNTVITDKDTRCPSSDFGPCTGELWSYGENHTPAAVCCAPSATHFCDAKSTGGGDCTTEQGCGCVTGVCQNNVCSSP